VVILGALEDHGARLEHDLVRLRKRARKSAEITEVFISALSNRLPESTMNPAFSRSGSSKGRITS
jgi:hypothetical protein